MLNNVKLFWNFLDQAPQLPLVWRWWRLYYHCSSSIPANTHTPTTGHRLNLLLLHKIVKINITSRLIRLKRWFILIINGSCRSYALMSTATIIYHSRMVNIGRMTTIGCSLITANSASPTAYLHHRCLSNIWTHGHLSNWQMGHVATTTLRTTIVLIIIVLHLSQKVFNNY